MLSKYIKLVVLEICLIKSGWSQNLEVQTLKDISLTTILLKCTNFNPVIYFFDKFARVKSQYSSEIMKFEHRNMVGRGVES